MTKLKRLKFAALITVCGLAIEVAAVALISPRSLATIPWLLQAAVGLIFFYAAAPLATMRLRLFGSRQRRLLWERRSFSFGGFLQRNNLSRCCEQGFQSSLCRFWKPGQGRFIQLLLKGMDG